MHMMGNMGDELLQGLTLHRGARQVKQLHGKCIDLDDAKGRIRNLACNLHVSDQIVNKMNATLERMLKDGTTKAIFREYDLSP
jgi:ABC-type amino acid transport substrate-binding protein